MKTILYLFFCFLTLSFSKGLNKYGIDNELVSAVLDFVPYVSNIKGLEEAIMGYDVITGKDLTDAERILSLISAIPSGKLLTNKKHLKNAKKFMKAAQRAKKAGKIKNFINFTKAAIRANKKAHKIGKLVEKGIKIAKVGERFVVKKLNKKQK